MLEFLLTVVTIYWTRDFPGGTSGKEPTCQPPKCRQPAFHPWVGRPPWRRASPPAPVFLPGDPRGQRSRGGYSPWGRRVRHDWSSLSTRAHYLLSTCVISRDYWIGSVETCSFTSKTVFTFDTFLRMSVYKTVTMASLRPPVFGRCVSKSAEPFPNTELHGFTWSPGKQYLVCLCGR